MADSWASAEVPAAEEARNPVVAETRKRRGRWALLLYRTISCLQATPAEAASPVETEKEVPQAAAAAAAVVLSARSMHNPQTSSSRNLQKAGYSCPGPCKSCMYR